MKKVFEFLNKYATLLLVIVTVFYAVSSWGTVSIMKDEFEASNRPYVGIVSEAHLRQDNELYFMPRIANPGNVSVEITSIKTNIPGFVTLPGTIILLPRQERIPSLEIDKPNKSQDLFFVIEIEYRNLFNEQKIYCISYSYEIKGGIPERIYLKKSGYCDSKINNTNNVNKIMTPKEFFDLSFWGWRGWEATSAIVLAFTLIGILFQALETKKFTKFSVMPNAYFCLRSARTSFNRAINPNSDIDFPVSTPIEQKLKTDFIICNNSEFPILFKVKIKFEIDSKCEYWTKEFWHKPLPAGLKISEYPNVINLGKFINEINNISNKEIVAHIKYTYAPEFASRFGSKTMSQTWKFNLDKYEWRGPAGIRDIKILL